MPKPGLGISALSLVVKGIWNPSVFSPAWLLAEELIGTDEYEQAEVEIISPEITRFACAWLRIQITRDALQYTTQDVPEFERLRDAVIGTVQRLSHTPVLALGINRETHFTVGSVEDWHRVGDRLTPKEFWANLLHLPGMRSLTVSGVREDSYTGSVNVQVEPSAPVPDGVFVNVNDHFDLGRTDRPITTRAERPWDTTAKLEPTAKKIPMVIEILGSEWESSQTRADKIAASIMELGGVR